LARPFVFHKALQEEIVARTTTVVILAMIFGFAGLVKTSSAADKLLHESDLEYLGAFRVPQGDYGSPTYSGFNFGGRALAINPGEAKGT
jgi:hypothetical protein